ncbi:anti-virulence regulator CigR family protein [Parvibaculum sp.]|uniref:anti-virulence regulator CigR family protein n=1 Tax=Parvibaculum sp. TaxID=2024848 RepID=UPI0039193144
MRIRPLAIMISLAFLLPAGLAQAKGGKPENPSGAGSMLDIGAGISVSFSADETRLIRDYFTANPYEAKPLPPGIAKNLARGKPLPPGIAKRYLPGDLVAGLPARPGYERIIVGSDILLVSIATGIIADILTGAF